MRFALSHHCSLTAIVATVAAVISAQPAFADGAFVTQAAKSASFERSLISSPLTAQSPVPFVQPHSNSGGITQPTPETTVPKSGGNFANTLEMGRNNVVLQSQSGAGNFSNVGIFGGVHDNVAVLQHGQGLFSNVVLAGVKGLSVDVIQPPGSAPVDLLIGKLPNGTLGVFQPNGLPPATLIPVPGGLLVFRR
jgi:hypothetical protein